jgi:hypothetical protein
MPAEWSRRNLLNPKKMQKNPPLFTAPELGETPISFTPRLDHRMSADDPKEIYYVE